MPIPARLRPILESLPRRPRPWLFTAGVSRKYPDGDHHANVKRLNEQLIRAASELGLPVGREGGYTLHSLRHHFETFTVNRGIPQRVIDTWLGHRSDRSMASIDYALRDEASQAFTKRVPFGPAHRRPTPARRVERCGDGFRAC